MGDGSQNKRLRKVERGGKWLQEYGTYWNICLHQRRKAGREWLEEWNILVKREWKGE